MNEVPTSPKCPQCGAAVATGAPEGLCPRCLLALNLDTATKLPGETAAPAAAAPAKTPLSIAEVAALFPQLEIVRLIGQGGMGAVYQARQPALDRFVALKILTTPVGEDRGFAERFTREARALAKLNHPSIVGVHDFGAVGGHFYLVMEYADGLNLRELLRAGKIVPAEALAIVPKICEALQYAHEHGIVHRDIKPENILLDQQGRVKIADFGIAKILGQAPASALTGAQDRMGTPHYMAPEQVEHPLSVDHRADIYSLGVVFYEMLTGELPLGRFAPPSRKVQLDVRLDEVVLRALEKEPERRYQQANEVKTQLETIAAAPAAGHAPSNRRTRWLAGLSAAALALMAVAYFALTSSWGRRAFFGTDNLVVVTGQVTDAAGRPIPRARVSDNIYGGDTDRAPRETWTKANGRYEFTTQREEHTLAASAPGYETTLALLRTGPFDSAARAEVNFKLSLVGDPDAIFASALPVVVATTPVSGSNDVEPGIAELRVRFSKPMNDQAWTWANDWNDSMPAPVEAPKFEPDHRTCTLKVTLEPDRTYGIWLNSQQTQKFQDEDGNRAQPYLLIFKTKPASTAPPGNTTPALPPPPR
jgi:hypothetical protein